MRLEETEESTTWAYSIWLESRLIDTEAWDTIVDSMPSGVRLEPQLASFEAGCSFAGVAGTAGEADWKAHVEDTFADSPLDSAASVFGLEASPVVADGLVEWA